MSSFKISTKRLPASSLQAFQEDSDADDDKEALEEVERLKGQGTEHAEAGQWSHALNCWERALQLTPDNGQLHELRAQVLNELGRSWDAVQAASRANELIPESVDVLVTLARCQLNLGEPQLALKSMEKVLIFQPENAEALAEIHEIRVLASRQQQLGVRAAVVSSSPAPAGS